MLKSKIVISTVLAALFVHVSLPATAGYYQTVYVPNNQTYVDGMSGQTIIVQGDTPTQTIVVKETTPNTVVVRETVSEPVYVPQTTYLSNEALIVAGVTGLVGGVLLGTALKNHHHKKINYAPISHYDPKPAHKAHKGRR